MRPDVAVIGAAGTGKTRWIADYLSDLRPRSALVMTYARSAAREITDRLAGMTGVYVHTAHSAALEVVAQSWRSGDTAAIDATGLLHPGAEVIPGASEPFVERARHQVPEIRVKALNAALRRCDLKAGDWTPDLRARLLMRRAGVVAPDDLIVLADRILRASPPSRPWDVVLLDEAQDASDLVWRFFDSIRATARVIAGDDAQGLYAFVGADVAAFRVRVAAAREVVHLDTVWRSKARIVNLADDIRAEIDGVTSVSLRSVKPGGIVQAGGVTIEQAVSRADALLGRDAAVLLLARTWRQVEEIARVASVAPERPDLRFGDMMSWATEAAIRCARRRALDATDAWIILRAAGADAHRWATDDVERIDAAGLFSPGWWSMLIAATDMETIAELLDAAGLDPSLCGEGPVERWRQPESPAPIGGWSATTVHQSKGREADAVIYLRDPRDSPVIRYVATSRAREAIWIVDAQSTSDARVGE